MYDFYGDKLPSVFKDFSISILTKYIITTQDLLPNYHINYLPKLRTNYGKFNIQFSGAKIGIPSKKVLNLSLVTTSRSCWPALY